MHTSDADATDATRTSVADNAFRFEVEVCAVPTLTVTTRFIAGLNSTKQSFWQAADAVEADVKRTNRAWRRKLSRAVGDAPAAAAK